MLLRSLIARSGTVVAGCDRCPLAAPGLRHDGNRPPLQRPTDFLHGLLAFAALAVIFMCPGTGRLRAADEPSFPIKPSPDGRYFVDARGQPFFYHADTAWLIVKKLTRAEIDAYLDQRKAQGFTAIQVHAVSREQGPPATLDGQEPFMPADNLAKPNEAYWKQLDYVLDAAARRNLLVAVSAIWLRWGGGDREGWRHLLNETNAASYGKFLGERYGKRSNLMWILGGDSNPIDRTKAIGELAMSIRRLAPQQLITVHNRPGYASGAFFDTQIWLDVNLAYTYEEVGAHVLGEWNRPGKKRPIVLGESGYEDENNDGRGGSPWRTRRQAYAAILSGALGGHAFGQKHVWRFDDQWRAGVESVASSQMAHVRALFASRSWFRLVPDQDHQLVPSERESFGRLDHVTGARTAEGTLAMIYFPTNRAVILDPTGLKLPLEAVWFDPTSGESRSFRAIEKPQRMDVVSPVKNQAGDPDFVLVLERGMP